MPQVSLNQVTTAKQSYLDFLDIAEAAGFAGVELRNDLREPLFSGLQPAKAGDLARKRKLSVHALAEVPGFNLWNDQTAAVAAELIGSAVACGATGVSLIPVNSQVGVPGLQLKTNLPLALRELKPLLEEAGIFGLIEPLGFATSSLRFKSEAVDAIDAVDGAGVFRLIHDTFHHTVGGDSGFFPQLTAMVHISGVNKPELRVADMADSDRVLVDESDVLGNIEQLATLLTGGYMGPISYEAFAPGIHDLTAPAPVLKSSIEYVLSRLSS